MKTTIKKRTSGIIGLLLWGICILSSQPTTATEVRVLAEPATIGRMQIQTWAVVDQKSRLKSIGVLIPAGELDKLPDQPFEAVLKLPSNINAKPFRHLAINWETHGHEPIFYMIPHLDFHFYMMDLTDRLNISCRGADVPVCMKPVPPDAVAANYIASPAAVPKMGWHFVDVTSPEFQGQPFTSTLIYGYYDGRMSFVEPMVTLDYLRTKPQFTRAIPQPKKYQEPGFYPTRYSVRYLNVSDRYEVSLDGMVYRK